MRKFKIVPLLLLVFIIFMLIGLANAQEPKVHIFFSVEEDFVNQGPVPSDGNPIISDGDLLNTGGYVYKRNLELLKEFEVEFDLGLDAADVIDIEDGFVAFSTELDHPKGEFTAGDLLTTNGAILPNSALLYAFDDIHSNLDLGLDAIHFKGKKEAIIEFLNKVEAQSREYFLVNPEALIELLEAFDIDIWFSTEGTAPKPGDPQFLDGDLLSAATGEIVISNSDLLPPSVPAGIPERGCDFGLDAYTLGRFEEENMFVFSTEILHPGEPSFTDGDVLEQGDGGILLHDKLINEFNPPKRINVGLDALSIQFTLIPAEKLPDLTVKNLVVNWHWDTTTKRAKAEIANIGDKDAGEFTVEFGGEENPVSLTNRPYKGYNIPSLAIGDSIWLYVDFDLLKHLANNFLGNVYEIRVMADPKGLVKEKNENNNEMCFTLP